jgi:hypothetical protein
LAASCTTLGPITKFDRQPNSQIPAHAPLTAKRCLDLVNLSFDNDLNADTIDRVLRFEQFGPDQIPATFMKPLLQHLLAHPEWSPVKRALFWQHSSTRLNNKLTSGFVSIPYRGSKGAYVFQGHRGEIILFTLDGRVYRASSTAEATNFDESLLDSLLSPAAQQIKLKQLMFKNSN